MITEEGLYIWICRSQRNQIIMSHANFSSSCQHDCAHAASCNDQRKESYKCTLISGRGASTLHESSFTSTTKYIHSYVVWAPKLWAEIATSSLVPRCNIFTVPIYELKFQSLLFVMIHTTCHFYKDRWQGNLFTVYSSIINRCDPLYETSLCINLNMWNCASYKVIDLHGYNKT